MSSYFLDRHIAIRYPLAIPAIEGVQEAKNGLRDSQIGAMGAITAHFVLKETPAVVTMPTGSGKTAVLMLTPFLLRATRVLVITPSRLVRSQIHDDYKDLAVLRKIGALDAVLVPDADNPSVYEVEGYVKTEADWLAMDQYDVVVSTPNSVSPAIKEVAKVPEGLFDLILVDEAHHSAAGSWQAILDSLPSAKKILFTATPFRRDKKEIKGDFIFSYPLRKSFESRVFGQVKFEAAAEHGFASSDLAIATRAAEIFTEDRRNGLKHYIMVRTDRKSRAKELHELYEKNTSLKLRLIHSGLTYGYIKQTITKLKKGELDGIVCVNMLGEGFDFPNLKIAAVHTPHRSLEVTLQFIGRFARTNSSDIGLAKFVALPNEIEDEIGKLYKEGAVWQDIIQNLSASRIDEEVVTREMLSQFNAPTESTEETVDISLYSLKPFLHVKIYAPAFTPDLEREIEFPSTNKLVYRSYSPELSAAIIVTQEKQSPKWTTLDVFDTIKYNLLILYWNEEHKLLFINSSAKSDDLYDLVSESIIGAFTKGLPMSDIVKVTAGISETKFYHVGMRKTQDSVTSNSYLVYSGPNASKSVTKTDGKNYQRGHVFGGGSEGGKSVTIGYSSSSKVWSLKYIQVPNLVIWCKSQAEKIRSVLDHSTNSGLDHLSTPITITSIPANIISARWNDMSYEKPVELAFEDATGAAVRVPQLEVELEIDLTRTTATEVVIRLLHDNFEAEIGFSFSNPELFYPLSANAGDIFLVSGNQRAVLVERLRTRPLQLFTADFARLNGNQLSKKDAASLITFDISQINPYDWETAKVDVSKEYEGAKRGYVSIHDHLKQLYAATPTDYDVVLYDHGSGETADFVLFKDTGKLITVELVHCKATKATKAGERVGDVYEVCSQVTKSIKWTEEPRALLKNLKRRFRKDASRFVIGDASIFDTIEDRIQAVGSIYTITLVQPGISKSKLTQTTGNVLAAANDYIVHNNCEPMKVIGAA
ncbi:DEAD/DEAH box helicase family protein [Hymenobacter sp. BT188]|uniref:DEAD/DEAH box helicase n=1 Tax=Hymenobacter sp. BT188 TaxID=2763504 RepID=UPI00165138E6|nr:DEAD/DEAH box helicase family protein [Hymenobacter sp. BT188]MBC6609095.1 DEAD/DEAH box helicase family protein [Hymenobacter sp. BT188]